LLEFFGIEVARRHLVLGAIAIALVIVAYGLILIQEAAARKLRTIDRKQMMADISDIAAKAASAVHSAHAHAAEYSPVLKDSATGVLSWFAPHFSFQGRLTRRQFVLMQFVVGLACAVIFGISNWLSDSFSSFSQGVGVFVFVLGVVLAFWLVLAAYAKRTRDTGIRVWWTLTLLVPPLNLAAIVFLFLVPTDEFAGRGY
jgi:uncharacterized membrane protein YhaH (DUF805 family)